MVEIPSPHAIVSRLVHLSRALDDAQHRAEAAAEHSLDTKLALMRAEATAHPETSGTVDERRHELFLLTETEYGNYERAKTAEWIVKEQLKELRDQVGITQSIGATMRAEFAASGVSA